MCFVVKIQNYHNFKISLKTSTEANSDYTIELREKKNLKILWTFRYMFKLLYGLRI